VDFENAQPTESEVEMYLKIEDILRQARDVLNELQTYKGAGCEIREAIANPLDDGAQRKAIEVVVPLVQKLKRFYEFSIKLSNMIPCLLTVLCCGPLSPYEHLRTQQALVKQFAEILDFVLKFDDLKMTNPSVQNDFSYYRRTMSRIRLANEDGDSSKFELSNGTANVMSLFYAQATPMLKVVSDATSSFVKNNRDKSIGNNTTETLATMAKVCQKMIENCDFRSRFTNEMDTVSFILRVMVGVIILYDHVHPDGAFVKSSHIDLKGSVRILREQSDQNESLLNALRYTTKHLNDESTPKAVKMLLT
jgi:hypothetical protein